MKRLTSLVGMILCLVLAASTAWAGYTSYDLDRANRMRDRSEYFEARRLYSAIANDYYASDNIRRQASYFVGFCSVRLSEPRNAINDFRRFLRDFDTGYNTVLVPDALYVLGRTYETVNEVERARSCYRDCINRFPSGEFSQKCRERLRIVGGHDDPYPHHYSMDLVSDSIDAGKATKKLSGSDPFDGFQMDLQQEKVDQLKEKFEALHAQP